MSANTLTGLVVDAQIAADRVLREQLGFIGAVYLDPAAEMVAKDQNITYPIVPTMAASDVSPAATPSEPTGTTVGYGQMTISKVRKVPFVWRGEEQKSVSKLYANIKQDQIAQAMRTLVNEIETDLALAVKKGASRAYGSAGTTPFGTANDLSDVGQVRKLLVDNGAWTDDMHFVLNTAAGANIRSKQSSLFKVNESGSEELLRDGSLLKLEGFNFHESGMIATHTKGTGTAYQLNGAHALNATTLAVDTGSGTLLAGDIITLANGTPADANKYVANADLASGSFAIGKPGLLSSHVDNDALTIGNNYLGNYAFERNAVHLLTRLPQLPQEGALGEHEVITDPYSGISFLLSVYPGYHLVMTEISIAWGYKVIKSEAIATLLG
jgi:hypothetical protein